MVFVFILAAVTFALILIFGYKSISGFLGTGEEVTFIRFKTDLESSIKNIASEYGAVRIQEFNPPLNYEKICFIDTNFYYGSLDDEVENQVIWLCENENMPLACSVWQDALTVHQEGSGKSGYDSVEENVFLKPLAPVKIKVGKISIADNTGSPIGYLCPPIRGGSFTLQLTGKGSHTEISEAVPGE